MNVRTAFILLALSALLSCGCSRSLESEGADGPYDAVSSLALSLKSPGNVPATKMTTSITQDGTPFRGIEQVYMIPFQTESAAPVEDGSARLGYRNVVINNSAIGKNRLWANNNSHLYDIVLLPGNMNRVLVYAKSSDDGSVNNRQGKHKNGVLIPYGLDNPSKSGDITFSLESILGPDEPSAISRKADNLIAALNGVVEALQASHDPEIMAFLDAFASDNEISACSYQTLYQFEQNFMEVLSQYSGTESGAEIINNSVMPKLSALQDARNAVGSGFPSSYGIPDGSIGLWWNGHRFVKLISGVNITLVPDELYCYPPSLWYYANSAIKTSANDRVREEYYNSQNATWGNILSHYTGGTSVTSSTRSTAIVDQMQYAVGLVEFRFLAPEGNAADAAGCPLTGIIIGEQQDVDFSFSPKESALSRFVFDNNVSGITLGNTSQSFQVLVLPTSKGQSVHFALEFENNSSSAFQCQQGTVHPGCKFYLAGELKPDEASNPSGAPTSVISSDYKTKVNVKVISLSSAYNTVPDLRDPQLEIGVEAEMDWLQVEPGGIKLPF